MGYKGNGINTGGIPVEYIRLFTEKYDIPVFIETGTAGGDSVRSVAPIFKKCHTIEIVEGRPSGEFPENVELHSGDSAAKLKEVADRHPNENIFFWLDAHWSEPYQAPEEVDECPILKEIKAIKHVGKRAVILIDDARLFFGRPPFPNDPVKWPRFQFVFETLRSCFPDHITTIVDDYIFCFPLYMDEIHRNEWYSNFNKRYPSDEEKLKNSVKMAYDAFLNYIK